MPKFKVSVSGYGGEYAAMKSSYDGLSELVKLYDEDSFSFLDKVDESPEESYHCVFVLIDDFEIEVTNADTGEVIDSSEEESGKLEGYDKWEPDEDMIEHFNEIEEEN